MSNYYITVSAGILDEKHMEKMRVTQRLSCIWIYLWLLDKITSIDLETGKGKILGGKPIKVDTDLAKYGNRKTVMRVLQHLEKEGYIETTRTPYGKVIYVLNAKKGFGWKPEKRSTTKGTSDDREVPLTTHPDRTLKGHHVDTQGISNKIDKEIDKKEIMAEVSDSAPISSKKKTPRQELLEWSIQRRGGGKFVNVAKQMKAFDLLNKAKISIERAKNRWGEMERDKFWKEKGFDWMNVYHSFDKKP